MHDKRVKLVHQRLDKDITWYCAVCRAENIDNPVHTSVPLCSDCGLSYSWDELNVVFCSCQVAVCPDCGGSGYLPDYGPSSTPGFCGCRSQKRRGVLHT